MERFFGNQPIRSARARSVVLFDLGLIAAVAVALLIPAGQGGGGAGGSAEGETSQEAAADPCALADALRGADEDKPARKAYVKVLEADPTARCALKGLETLNAPAKKSANESCAIGDTYIELDRKEDAAAAYKKGLEADPAAKCATEGLEKARSDGPSIFTRVADWFLDAISTALVWIGILLLIAMLVLLTGYWHKAKKVLLKLPLVRRLLSPRLTFESIADDSLGDHKWGGLVMARIKMLLAQMREDALSKVPAEYDLDFGTAREQFADLVSAEKGLKSALDHATDISDQTKLVGALLNLVYAVLPIQRFELTGHLEPALNSHVGATFLLEEDSELRAGTTVREPLAKEGETALGDYMNLVAPAAVWIQFEVASAIENNPPDARAAESQALLDEGLRHYRDGSLEEARASYEKALRADPLNWAVYVSLAVAEARAGEDFDRSIARIEEGLRKMRGKDRA